MFRGSTNASRQNKQDGRIFFDGSLMLKSAKKRENDWKDNAEWRGESGKKSENERRMEKWLRLEHIDGYPNVWSSSLGVKQR